jgi:hypothetical protein
VTDVGTEFLPISKAVSRLEAGMFGGAIKRPEPVAGIKDVARRYTLGSGVRRQKAALAIQKAIMAGALGVNVFAPATGTDGTVRPLLVPIDVLKRLPKVRGSLPDHLVRHPFNLLRNCPIAADLFAALSASPLYINRSEFIAWYQKEKRKGRWPSQAASNRLRVGRPSKQTDDLIRAIKALTNEGLWSAPDGIAELVRLLASRGAPDRYLVGRTVQKLFEETSDPRYRIIPRKREKGKPRISTT